MKESGAWPKGWPGDEENPVACPSSSGAFSHRGQPVLQGRAEDLNQKVDTQLRTLLSLEKLRKEKGNPATELRRARSQERPAPASAVGQ